MSKRTRYADNSKRQQPIQQQRAQARMPASQGASPKAEPAEDTRARSNPETQRRRKESNR